MTAAGHSEKGHGWTSPARARIGRSSASGRDILVHQRHPRREKAASTLGAMRVPGAQRAPLPRAGERYRCPVAAPPESEADATYSQLVRVHFLPPAAGIG